MYTYIETGFKIKNIYCKIRIYNKVGGLTIITDETLR